MTSRIVCVLIDDNADRSQFVKRMLSTYLDMHTLLELDEMPGLMARIERQGGLVDLIVSDINMEADKSARRFNMQTGRGDLEVTPRFAMAFRGESASGSATNEGLDRSHDFKPFGPILALPIAQYFRGGGVIVPVSGFWQDDRLILRDDATATAEMNGFVFVALRLIWERGDADLAPSQRMAKFAERLSAAYRTASEKSNPMLIVDQVKDAVRERREQLFRQAYAVQGLDDFTVDQVFDDAAVTIWMNGHPVRHLERRSLFADYALRIEDVQAMSSGNEALEQGQAAALAKELATLDTGPDIERLRSLACEFAYILSETADPEMFDRRYARALDASGGAAPGFPQVGRSCDLPSYIRRYLVLSAQLHLFSQLYEEGEAWDEDAPGNKLRLNSNEEMAKALGIKPTAKSLKDFVLGPHSREVDENDPWVQRFWTGPGEGWQPWNLQRSSTKKDGGGIWVWTDLDCWIAQAIWARLDCSSKLPHGLDRPIPL